VRFLTVLCLSSLMVFLGTLGPADAADVKAIAAAVDAHYNHLRSLEADFTELYRGAGMERTE